MEKELREAELSTLSCDVFQLFSKATPLLTAGNRENLNTMTIGWGGLGTLWGKPVCTVYVRPERHTYAFMEENDLFTVSVFPGDYKEAMALCGTKSGRDTDKVSACGLTPLFAQQDVPYFAQAELVFVCRKLYAQDLAQEHIVDGTPILPYYGANGNWHRMYIGEVLQVLKK